MFKEGPMNIVTVFACRAVTDVQPRQWKCSARGHEGWPRTMSTCEACGRVGHLEQLPGPNICVIHRESDVKSHSWDDVAGAEFKRELAVQAQEEETGQIMFTNK